MEIVLSLKKIEHSFCINSQPHLISEIISSFALFIPDKHYTQTILLYSILCKENNTKTFICGKQGRYLHKFITTYVVISRNNRMSPRCYKDQLTTFNLNLVKFFRYFYSHACNNNRLLQRNQTTLIKDGMRLQTRRYCFILFTNRGDRTGS